MQTPMKITMDSIICTRRFCSQKQELGSQLDCAKRYLCVSPASRLMVRMHLDSAARARTQQAGGSRISIRNPSRRLQPPVQNSRSSLAVPRPPFPNSPPRRKMRAPFLGSHAEASTEPRDKRRDRCTRVHSRVMQKGTPLALLSLIHFLTVGYIRVTGLSSLCASLRRSPANLL